MNETGIHLLGNVPRGERRPRHTTNPRLCFCYNPCAPIPGHERKKRCFREPPKSFSPLPLPPRPGLFIRAASSELFVTGERARGGSRARVHVYPGKSAESGMIKRRRSRPSSSCVPGDRERVAGEHNGELSGRVWGRGLAGWRVGGARR
jgi:hypothetical protein